MDCTRGLSVVLAMANELFFFSVRMACDTPAGLTGSLLPCPSQSVPAARSMNLNPPTSGVWRQRCGSNAVGGRHDDQFNTVNFNGSDRGCVAVDVLPIELTQEACSPRSFDRWHGAAHHRPTCRPVIS